MNNKINKPLVSVVLPVYNGQKFLSKSIESIINQTYKNWELIIVDDCSTDSSHEIAKDFALKDNRITVIKNDRNLKLPASLNIGFNYAKGDYYTWTSDDNEYYPEAFSKMADFLENNSYYGMVYAQTNVEKDDIIQDYVWCDGAVTPITLLSLCVPGACFMYRKTVAQEVGQYNENCFLNEDHEYWLRILLKTGIGNLNETLYLYRLRKGSLTETKSREIKAGKAALLKKYRRIYAEVFPQVKYHYKTELFVDDLLEGKVNIKNCKENIPARNVYKVLKQEYLYNGNKNCLKCIKSLGFKYFIKAWLLEFRAWKRCDV